MIKKLLMLTLLSIFSYEFYAMDRPEDSMRSFYTEEELFNAIKRTYNLKAFGKSEDEIRLKLKDVKLPWGSNLGLRCKIAWDILGFNPNSIDKNGKAQFLNMLDHLSADSLESFMQSHRFCDICYARCTTKCGACRITHYCSVECQRKDWPTHKTMCPNIRNNKINLNMRDRNGDIPLIYLLRSDAVLDRNAKIQMLIDAGAAINACDKLGMTPLMIAMQENKVEAVKILLKAEGLNIHLKNDLEETVFDIAKDKNEISKILDKHRANCSRLLLFAVRQQSEAVKRLIDSGADVNAHNDRGDSVLGLAISVMSVSPDHLSTDLALIKQLIDAGANVNHVDGNGQSILTLALSVNLTFNLLSNNSVSGINLIELLVDSGADVNFFEREAGATPLMYAVCGSDLESVKYLVRSGADINCKDVYGRTAYDTARNKGLTDIAKFLGGLKAKR